MDLPSVSAIGLNARACNACIALSCIVGILKGRFLSVPGFGIYTLRSGFALYFLSDNLSAAFILELGVVHFAPSIPAVLFPLFCVTVRTANNFA